MVDKRLGQSLRNMKCQDCHTNCLKIRNRDDGDYVIECLECGETFFWTKKHTKTILRRDKAIEFAKQAHFAKKQNRRRYCEEQRYVQQGRELDYLMECIKIAEQGKSLGILLSGPPGTGKTLLAISLAKHFNSRYFIIDGSPQLDRRDLEGCWEIINGQTRFSYGPLVLAVKEANKNGICFLIINEANTIQTPEQISLNGILSEGHLNLISKSSERHGLNSDAKLIVIATVNFNVLGINELQEAFNDRFPIGWKFDYPEKRKEIEIITRNVPCSEGFASVVVEAADHLRKAALIDKSLNRLFSTRMCVNFASIVARMGKRFLKQSVQAIIVNKLSEDEKEQKFVEEFLKGIDFKPRLIEQL